MYLVKKKKKCQKHRNAEAEFTIFLKKCLFSQSIVISVHLMKISNHKYIPTYFTKLQSHPIIIASLL